VSAPLDHLSLKDTTPVTEALENTFDKAARSLRDVSLQLQGAISIATHHNEHADEEFVIQTVRLGLALVNGFASTWSAGADGLALIADDEAEWWWSGEFELPFAEADRHGVVRASVSTIPEGVTIPSRLVRVARSIGGDEVDLTDRGAGVPPQWDGKCYVSVRQYDGYIPGAALVTFRMVGAAGQTIAELDPVSAVFSM